MNNEKMLLSVKEVIQILGIPRSSMYKILKNDDFPKIKVGRTIYIDQSKLQAWIDGNMGKGVL